MSNTPNYDLPLLDTSNIPSWLVGWNQAMNTIDLALDGLQEQIDGIDGGGSSVVVDSALSETSTNPVQNKIITAYLNQLTARVAALEKDSTITITTQPINVSAYKGQSFTFSVTAESQLPLSYKWYFKGSADTEFTETNTTTNTYTATATSDRIGAIFEYKCKVSNGLQEVWSDVGTLTIVAAPIVYSFTLTSPNDGVAPSHTAFTNYQGTITPAPSQPCYLIFMEDDLQKAKLEVEIRNNNQLYKQVHYSNIPLYAGKYTWYFETSDEDGNTYKSESRNIWLT